MTAPIDALLVVVPARDEEVLLPAALDALERAVAAVRLAAPVVAVRVVVAVDSSVDATAALAARPGVDVLEVAHGSVGRTRDVAVRYALDGVADPGRCWIASTDADSEVPEAWLVDQLGAARDGVALRLGSVRPGGLTARQLARWHDRNPQGEGHPYVHGANLGVRGDVFLAAGGFPHVRVHEDVGLARAVEASGASVLRSDRHPVRTSGRTVGRTPAGFAGYVAREIVSERPAP